jgi:hypothetical protein
VPLALIASRPSLGDLHVACGLDAELGRYQVGVLVFADVDRWRPGAVALALAS